MNPEVIFKLVAISSAGFGLYATRYIRRHKKAGTKMTCPLDSNCEVVVHSNYSKILGIPLELIGSIYYALIFLTYLFELITPFFLPPILAYTILGATAAAFFFSLYLTGVQLFKIKEWCMWCLVSASMCLLIFITTIINFSKTLLTF